MENGLKKILSEMEKSKSLPSSVREQDVLIGHTLENLHIRLSKLEKENAAKEQESIDKQMWLKNIAV